MALYKSINSSNNPTKYIYGRHMTASACQGMCTSVYSAGGCIYARLGKNGYNRNRISNLHTSFCIDYYLGIGYFDNPTGECVKEAAGRQDERDLNANLSSGM